jgi:hypothetical protein
MKKQVLQQVEKSQVKSQKAKVKSQKWPDPMQSARAADWPEPANKTSVANTLWVETLLPFDF